MFKHACTWADVHTHARTHARTQNMHTPLAMDTEKTEKDMKMKECKAEKGYEET